MKSLGIFSHVIPPIRNGHSLVIERLFDDYCDNSILFTDGCDNSFFKNVVSVGGTKNKKMIYVLQKNNYIYKMYNIFIKKYRYFDAIKKVEDYLNNNKVDLLISFSGELFYPDICRKISEKYNIPFYFYMLDDYEEQWLNKVDKDISKSIMGKIVNSTMFSGFIVTNEVIFEKYNRKYTGTVAYMIRNPMPELNIDCYDEYLSEYINQNDNLKDLSIVYTGSIYDAHFDAFETLISAIDLYNSNFGKSLYLNIYTGQNKYYLNHNIKNLDNKCVKLHGIINNNKELMDVQKNATILFLPLGLHTKYPEIIKTSSPGKLGEYLISGIPVLARVPKDSYISKYLNEYMCISSCDKAGVEDMYFKICNIMIGKYKDRMICRAFKYGISEFSIDVNKDRLKRILED